MQPPSSPHTPDNWSAVSRRYDVHLADFTGQYGSDLLAAAAFPREAHILEVAAGTGAVTVQLAPHVAHVTATDYAPGMLAQLHGRLRAHGVHNVTVGCMDGQALDLPEGAFDGALCNFGLMLFADRAPRALRGWPGAPVRRSPHRRGHESGLADGSEGEADADVEQEAVAVAGGEGHGDRAEGHELTHGDARAPDHGGLMEAGL